jgi:hypothetical protein
MDIKKPQQTTAHRGDQQPSLQFQPASLRKPTLLALCGDFWRWLQAATKSAWLAQSRTTQSPAKCQQSESLHR